MRYERKFRIEDVDERLLRQIIHNNPYHFRSAFPDRLIVNIYYDTPEFSCFEQNVAGIAIRNKYRLRWYQSDWGKHPFGYQWEVKKKENQLGSKDIFPFEQDVDPPPFFRGIPQLRPTLMNAYHRSYFLSGCKRFRLTLDRSLVYALPPLFPRKDAVSVSEFPFREEAKIVELKYDQDLDGRIDDLTRYFPFRQTRNSKYVQGVELVYHGLS